MKIIILLLLISLISITTVKAEFDYKLEGSIRAGSTGNLLKDSSETSDIYSTYNATVRLYFLPQLELNMFGEYTYYSQLFDLSNTQYGGGLSFIPTSDSSRFNLFLSANYRRYSYRGALTVNSNEFISESINGIISLGYSLSDQSYLKAGYNFNLTGYEIDDIENRIENDIFAGVNYTFWGSNSFDFEFGYSFGNFNYYRDTLGALRQFDNIYDQLIDDKQNSSYFSLRLSRPLGSKSGLSVNYLNRSNNSDIDTAVVLGYSTIYLDPWAAKFEGEALIIRLKSFIIPGMILSSGFGYWDKEYYPTVEGTYDEFLEDTDYTTWNTKNRNDITRRYFLSAQTPFVSTSGLRIEPTLNIEYTENQSTINVYQYEDLTVSLNILVSY